MKNRLRKVQFKYLDYLFEDMYSVKSKEYPDSIFFKKDNKVILELESSGTLWVLYLIWSNISDTFSFQYDETQELIKEWVEEQIKSGEITPQLQAEWFFTLMEEQIKSKEVTPSSCGMFAKNLVEEQIELEKVTPVLGRETIKERVEEELKSVEITPNIEWQRCGIWVEEQLKSRKYIEIINPNPTLTTYHLKVVEEQLKSEEITPKCNYFDYGKFIEEQLKSREITPKLARGQKRELMEKQIKSVEITPSRCNLLNSLLVEEELKVKATPIKGFQYFMNEEELKPQEIKPHLGHTYEMGKIDEEYEKK